jgi:hypothetical protein
MRLTPRPKLKGTDLHIRLNATQHETLKKISMLKNTTMTKIIEEHISQLKAHHNL